MNILIVCAHPDDECLGCGGTIARYVAEGHAVSVLFLGTGCGSRESMEPLVRFEERDRACRILGHGIIPHDFYGRFEDNEFDKKSRLMIVKEIERYIELYQPDTIFTNTIGDINIDHRRTAEAVQIATRPKPICRVKAVYGFEVPSSTEWIFPGEFAPNVFVELSDDDMDKKIAAMKEYKSELQKSPHPRSIDGIINQAKYRGQGAGVKYAEAFELIREIK